MKIGQLNKDIPITSIETIIEYLYADELKHYEEGNELNTEVDLNNIDKTHIFYHINKVNQWLKSQRRSK